MSEIIRFTRSVCPVCLKNIPAVLRTEDSGRIVLQKTCPDHGFTSVPVWQGLVDFDRWTKGSEPLSPGSGLSCPENCGSDEAL